MVSATMAFVLLLRGRWILAGVCLLCFFALLRPSVVYGAEVCQPTRYADGDTFSYRHGGDLVRVRVAGFDAPERGQPYSRRATEMLRALTGSGALCNCYKRDRHGRSVCTVRTRTGDNVAAVMLAAGLGCIDPRFEGEASGPDREAARAALAQAQAQRVGMWALRDVQCAFDYRRAQRAK
jgi:micrococcal nuclease